MDHLPVIPSPVVTVGSFDGVHVGHRVIISRLNDLAKQVAGSSVLITFHPHPRIVLYPETAGKDLRLISSQAEKIMLLEEAGLDHLVIIEFTLAFARTSSDDFVKLYLLGKLHAHTIVVGFNHYFGHNREGSYDSLYKLRAICNFEVEEIPEQEIQHETVSSTKIRKALSEGNIQRANAYLEHHYLIQAEIEIDPARSAQYHHPCYKILSKDPVKLLPPRGGYAASVKGHKRPEKGLVYMGEDEALFLPLEAKADAGRNRGTFHFHKRLNGEEALNMAAWLDEVRELIY